MNKLLENNNWTNFDIIWPWIGLGAAILMLIILFTSNFFRYDNSKNRWRDPVWLSWFAVPLYMVHQFEEYGVDLLGIKHAFPDGLCTTLGLETFPECTIPHNFFLFVNIPLVWVFALFAAKFSSKNYFVGLGLYSVIITNAIMHIAIAVFKQQYNPGLLSAIVIFLPAFFWICKVCFAENVLRKSGIIFLIATGFLVHLILIGSILLFLDQKINSSLLNLIQITNGSVIILLPWLGDKIFKITGNNVILN